MPKQAKFVALGIVLICIVLLIAGCAAPARHEQMVVAATPAGEARLGSVYLTVYGDDVGGFASHYYPLPRGDFEAALLKSVSTGGVFLPFVINCKTSNSRG